MSTCNHLEFYAPTKKVGSRQVIQEKIITIHAGNDNEFDKTIPGKLAGSGDEKLFATKTRNFRKVYLKKMLVVAFKE